jgi:hypothetical protein
MTGQNYNAVVPALNAPVEPVEKVHFLTNGRSNPFKIDTFLGHLNFSHSLVRQKKQYWKTKGSLTGSKSS